MLKVLPWPGALKSQVMHSVIETTVLDVVTPSGRYVGSTRGWNSRDSRVWSIAIEVDDEADIDWGSSVLEIQANNYDYLGAEFVVVCPHGEFWHVAQADNPGRARAVLDRQWRVLGDTRVCGCQCHSKSHGWHVMHFMACCQLGGLYIEDDGRVDWEAYSQAISQHVAYRAYVEDERKRRARKKRLALR